MSLKLIAAYQPRYAPGQGNSAGTWKHFMYLEIDGKETAIGEGAGTGVAFHRIYRLGISPVLLEALWRRFGNLSKIFAGRGCQQILSVAKEPLVLAAVAHGDTELLSKRLASLSLEKEVSDLLDDLKLEL